MTRHCFALWPETRRSRRPLRSGLRSWRMGCSLLALGLAAPAWALGTVTAQAAPLTMPSPAQIPQQGPGSLDDERAQITADELVHDRDLDTVTARGAVEIQYAGRLLQADTVNYQPGKDYATANGHVILVENDGSTLFADHVELTGKLKDGFAQQVRVLLADGSMAAARQAKRSDGQRTELDHSVYSACDQCGPDPRNDRIWQVKAIKVIHDQQERDITYYDAWLELFGVPVAYTPYMSHPDPSVKQKSGFLAPSYGGTSGLGATLTAPYYYTFSPHEDLTVSPMFTTEQRVMLAAEYRMLASKGEVDVVGSITQDSDDRVRNHVDAKLRQDLSETWRMGADVNMTSDDTYMRKYGYTSPAFLTTRPYVEGFGRRSYASLESYYFQDLRQTTTLRSSSAAPVVAPLAQWDYVSEPGVRGAWSTWRMGLAALERDSSDLKNSTDSRRMSAEYGWHVPHVGPIGDVYRLDLSMRGDIYNVENQLLRDGTSFTGNAGRFVPEAALTWSLPFGRQHRTYYEQVEPIVQGIVSPRGQNSDKIPNEDSLDYEFGDTNLFSNNRFTGFDRLENGPRVNYGLSYTAYGQRDSRLGVLLGQTWHANNDSLFSPTSGLNEEFSDYVGRVLLHPSPNLDILYRFRFDKDSLEAQRNELALQVGPPTLRFQSSYTLTGPSALSEGSRQNREEVAFGVSSQLTRYWKLSADTRYDLADDGGPLRFGGSVQYDDECFTLSLGGAREYTYDRDYEDGYRFALRVVFKTLGEVNTTASP